MAQDAGAVWARVGGFAGLGMLSLVIVFGIFGGMLVGAGEPPSGTTDEAILRAYWGHAALAPLALWAGPGVVLGILFFLGAREAWGRTPTGARATRMAFVLFSVAAPAFLVESAIVAAIVHAGQTGGDIGTWFRFYDVLYNSYLDIVMGACVLFLSLALLASVPSRRAQASLGFVVAALHAVIAITPWIPLPGVVRAGVMMLFSGWFGWVAVSLARFRLADPSLSAPVPGGARVRSA